MIREIDPKQVSTAFIHKFLLGSVAPRPIAFASTIDRDGRPNLAPFSFFNAFGVNPTTLIFSPSRRGRDGTTKHTYQNIKEVPEVVINVVTYDMVHQTSLASTEYLKGVNEFVKAGFTAEPSVTVRPFRVKESPVQFECKVRQVIETGEGGGAANLVICEILMIHANEEILDSEGLPDAHKIRLIGRHGREYYVAAFGESLFEVEKPKAPAGMGIDQLPEAIRHSKILTGNNLGQLGNFEKIPSSEEIHEICSRPEIKMLFQQFKNNPVQLNIEIQLLAKKMMDEGKVWEAFVVLMGDCCKK